MTIQEAIKSGKKFRRKDAGLVIGGSRLGWFDAMGERLKNISLSLEDILATDWEIYEEKIELTKQQIIEAVHGSERSCPSIGAIYTYTPPSKIEKICKLLGFK